MSELKTKKTNASVSAFLETVSDPVQREDSRRVLELMKAVTGARPKMWGSSIVGFGQRQYKYASGREGEWPVIGFSPRKGTLTLYLPGGLDRYQRLLAKLGKHKTGKGCLYIKKLDDVDVSTLRSLVEQSVREAAE